MEAVRVGRVYRFEAAHRLYTPRLSEGENEEVYGKCSRSGGHGHNYELWVIFEGKADGVTGLLFSREEIDRRVRERVIDRVDHRNLDDVVEGVTTGERLALVFREWLEPSFVDGPSIQRVELVETPRNRFVA